MKSPRALILSHAPCHPVYSESSQSPQVFRQDWASNTETYAIWDVCAQVWGLCNRHRCKWDSFFILSGEKLRGSRHTYTWLWFRAGKTELLSQDKQPPKVLIILFSLHCVNMDHIYKGNMPQQTGIWKIHCVEVHINILKTSCYCNHRCKLRVKASKRLLAKIL